MLYEELSHQIILSFYKVYNTLGFGFLEKVYVNALRHELIKGGLKAEKNTQIKVMRASMRHHHYDTFLDILIDGSHYFPTHKSKKYPTVYLFLHC